MLDPEWPRLAFALLLGVICVSCLARLATAHRHPALGPGRHEDLGQLLMCAGMVVMLLVWPGAAPRAGLLLAFGAMAAWSAGLLIRGRPGTGPAGRRDVWECVHHLVASLAMAYLAVAMPDHPGQPPTVPVLAVAFGMYFLLYAGWAAVRAVGTAGTTAPAGSIGGGVAVLLRRPRIVDGCRAAMGLGMAYVLLM